MVAMITSNLNNQLSRLALKIVVMTRELLTLNWEEVLGNFTFRYLCWFFPFTYLSNEFKIEVIEEF